MSILHYQSDGEFNVQLFLADGKQFFLFNPVGQIKYEQVLEELHRRGLFFAEHSDYECLTAAFPHLRNQSIVCPKDFDPPSSDRKARVGMYKDDKEGRPRGYWAYTECPFDSGFYFLSVIN